MSSAIVRPRLASVTIEDSPTRVVIGAPGLRGPAGLDGIVGTNGTNGTNGAAGADGVGLPVGGSTGQLPVKASAADYHTAWGAIGAVGHGAQTGPTLHALVTASAHGFLDAGIFDGALGKSTTRELIWRENFAGPINPKLTTVAAGGGFSQVATVTGSLGVGRIGTAAVASRGGHMSSLNLWYNNAALLYESDTVVRLVGPLATAGNDFRVFVGGIGDPNGSWTGFAAVYDRTVSANWQLARYTSGSGTFVDTGVAVDLTFRRFKIVYDTAAASATLDIDGARVATISSVPSVSATWMVAGYIQWVAGASREVYEAWSEVYITRTTALPG